jgi:hypothetical protein
VTTVLEEIKKAAQEAPSMYFAPLIGAIEGIRDRYRNLSSLDDVFGYSDSKPQPDVKPGQAPWAP